MNGKKAKALRKQAQEMTIGQPLVEYDIGRPPLFANKGDQRLPFFVKVVKGVPTKLKKSCTRAVYKQLKLGY